MKHLALQRPRHRGDCIVAAGPAPRRVRRRPPAGRRGARFARDRVHPVSQPEPHRVHARRDRRVAAARLQHGNARRSAHIARGGGSNRLSRGQFRSGLRTGRRHGGRCCRPVSGKELVESRCTACHDLERVALAKRQKGSGPRSSPTWSVAARWQAPTRRGRSLPISWLTSAPSERNAPPALRSQPHSTEKCCGNGVPPQSIRPALPLARRKPGLAISGLRIAGMTARLI